MIIITSELFERSFNLSEIVYQGKLAGAFYGFNRDKVFKTTKGTYWIQARYKYWYHYKYRPGVTIRKDNGRHYLSVEGKEIEVRKLNNVIESNVDGGFKDWEGKSVYSLRNGQVWQQDEYHYEYKYEYAPEVMIYEISSGTYMSVADTVAKVRRIR